MIFRKISVEFTDGLKPSQVGMNVVYRGCTALGLLEWI